jgi:hypothetical protein
VLPDLQAKAAVM